MQSVFQNKVAIVTGSSNGIGKATAKALLEAGAKVVLNGRNPEKLQPAFDELKLISENLIAISADISKNEEAEKLVMQTIDHFGQLDILINNAGVSMRGSFADIDTSVFQKVFDINVHGSVNTAKAALPHLRKTKGSLVFISSVAGIRGLPFLSAYSASKMALRAITDSIRIEESDSGIHVGLIYVGMTEVENSKQTIMADGSLKVLADRNSKKVQTTDEVAHSILKNVRKRKYKTVLSGLGRLNAIMDRISPWVGEKVLIKGKKKIQSESD